MHRRPHLTRPHRVAAVGRPAGLLTLAGLLGVLGVLGLAGCSGSSAFTPAPQATAPACAALVARVPGSVADQERAADPGAGAAAWGDPAIVLRCGLPLTTPTTTPCSEVNGIDWLVEQDGDRFRLTTYGRDPSVEVLVPASYGVSKANAAMVDLGPAVQPLPVERRCS